MILEPNVAIMVETHFEVNTTLIKIDNQIVIIQVQVGKNIVEDVLLDGGASVSIIIDNLKTKSGLPERRLVPYPLKMVNQNMNKPLDIIKKLKIHIPYVATFTIYRTMWSILTIPCYWEDLDLKMQRLHMTRATMSLQFKVMEQSKQYQLIKNKE